MRLTKLLSTGLCLSFMSQGRPEQRDAEGHPIDLRGVIVTAVDSYGANTGDFFVQDAEGGEFSGVKVVGAPRGKVAELAPGDIIDISHAEKMRSSRTHRRRRQHHQAN